jgi:cytochrome c-type protein NapB
MIGKAGILLLVAAIAATTGTLAAQSLNSSLRGSTPLNDEGPAAPMPQMRNTAEKETRNYPEQPPVIPHAIDGYQIDLNSNRCLSCHARARTAESQAPMVSITHFMANSWPRSRRGASSAPSATCRRPPSARP